MGRALDRYHAGRVPAVRRRHPKARADGYAARRGDGDHNHHTDDCDCRSSVRRDDQRANAQAASSRIRTMTCSNCGVIVMTDQQLAIQAVSDAQRILEEYLTRLRLRPTKRVGKWLRSPVHDELW